MKKATINRILGSLILSFLFLNPLYPKNGNGNNSNKTPNSGDIEIVSNTRSWNGNFTNNQGLVIQDGGRLEITGDLTSYSTITVNEGGVLIVHGSLISLSTQGNSKIFVEGLLVVAGDCKVGMTDIVNESGNLVVGGNFSSLKKNDYKDFEETSLYILNPDSKIEPTPELSSDHYGNLDDFIANEAGNTSLWTIVENLGLVKKRYKWLGTKDALWSNPDNWNGDVPGVGASVELSKEAKYQPVIGEGVSVEIKELTIGENTSLTIKPSASLYISGFLQNNGTFVLESTFDRLSSLMVPEDNADAGEARIILTDIPADRWHYLGHPIKDPQAGIYDVNHKVYKIEKSWLKLTDSETTLNALEGVCVRYDASHDLDYAGTLNSGNTEFEYKWGNGYYILSNPYPTAIDWKKEDNDGWSRKNISSTIWHLVSSDQTADQIITYNGYTGAVNLSEAALTEYGYDSDNISHIAPYESVWIKVDGDGSGSINIDNKAQVHNTLSLKSSSTINESPDMIRFSIKNSELNDGSVLYFREDFDLGQDLSDSEKKFNSSKLIPEIYTRIGTSAMAINGLPTLTEDSYRLPISVRNRVEGAVTLSVNLSRFNDVYSVFLEDTQTGIMTNLRETPDYEYTPSTLGDTHDRFVLYLKKVTTAIVEPVSLEEDESDNISIIGFGSYAKVSIANALLQQGQGEVMVAVLDLNGRLVNQEVISQEVSEVDLPRNSGLYVVRVQAGSTMKSEKVMVQNR